MWDGGDAEIAHAPESCSKFIHHSPGLKQTVIKKRSFCCEWAFVSVCAFVSLLIQAPLFKPFQYQLSSFLS